ncbi:MAG: outer membrane beta-barrel domain-containing protein [Bdellovibrionales bacterium]|nr:outer membrane beta-barrel domain-containing protein [Bdellovibrionales bacterium]
MKWLTILLVIQIFPSLALAEDIMKDFDSLGGNDVLINRAKVLQPDKDVKIVQNRIVKRKWRSEFSGNYSNVIGGDAYLETQSLGLNYHLHINHRLAIGANYFTLFNNLSKEGKFLVDQQESVPDVDEPRNGFEVFANFSPIYGKINLLDMGVVQFDTYGILSYGTLTIDTGETTTNSLGAAIGLWISQHLTSRLEIRQRFYESQRFGGPTDIQATLASFSIGYML